ncbi:unnamed protein product [Tenebrio molitor]|nr:unnamed protein product [Tenebrio molitor]
MRIAPVSCEDDWALCYQLIIEFYQGSYIEYKKSFTLLSSTTRKRWIFTRVSAIAAPELSTL